MNSRIEKKQGSLSRNQQSRSIYGDEDKSVKKVCRPTLTVGCASWSLADKKSIIQVAEVYKKSHRGD